MKRIFKNLLLFGMATAVCVACSKENEVTKQEEQKKETPENTTEEVKIVDGAITAAFSVSETKKVYFSQGNLQYQASTNTWRFATNQYDCIGKEGNEKKSSTYSGWVDLFGWGTSGYTIKPYTKDGVSGSGNSIAGTKNDWGVYNGHWEGWLQLKDGHYKKQ